jgi:hypothetical protein
MGGVTIDGTTQPPGTDQPEAGVPVGAGVPGYPAYYVSYPAPRPVDPAQRRRRRIFGALAAFWALVLLGSGIWYSFHGAHTVREQTTIAQSAPVVDEAAARVLAAAGTGPVAMIGGFTSTGGCDVTPVRRGEEWARGVRFATPVGTEPALLQRIGDGLPARYDARVHTGTKATTLYADAGDYVAISGAVESPGLVKVLVTTGCRPVGHQPAADPASAPDGPERTAVTTLLSALGATPANWAVHDLSCGPAGGGSVRTVTATAPTPSGGLAPAAGSGTVVRTDELVAARSGAVATIVRGDTDTVTVSATTGACSG